MDLDDLVTALVVQLIRSWIPTSRTVFAKLLYHYGGCMCGSASIPQVFKL